MAQTVDRHHKHGPTLLDLASWHESGQERRRSFWWQDTVRWWFTVVLTKTMASGTRRPGRGQVWDEDWGGCGHLWVKKKWVQPKYFHILLSKREVIVKRQSETVLISILSSVTNGVLLCFFCLAREIDVKIHPSLHFVSLLCRLIWPGSKCASFTSPSWNYEGFLDYHLLRCGLTGWMLAG